MEFSKTSNKMFQVIYKIIAVSTLKQSKINNRKIRCIMILMNFFHDFWKTTIFRKNLVLALSKIPQSLCCNLNKESNQKGK